MSGSVPPDGLSDDDVKALHKLAQSPMVRPMVGYLITALIGTGGAAIGWVLKTLDTKADITDMRNEFRTLGGQVAIANGGISDVRRIVEGLTRSQPPDKGDIPVINDQLVGMGRQIVFARAAALSTENAATKAKKTHAGEDWSKGYENLLRDNDKMTPAMALSSLFAKTAIPEE